MPIVGKTDIQQEEVGKLHLQVVGRLWKGTERKPVMENGKEKKDKYGNPILNSGTDLKDKFRFEAPDPFRDKFHRFYGDSFPKQVRVYLPFDSTDDVFETWMESYTAQGFQHRCNGDRIIQEKVKTLVKTAQGDRYHFGKENCDKPCLRGDSPVCPVCNYAGRLFFYIQELYSTGIGSTKCFMMSVTGVHDVVGFTQQLRALEAKYGSLQTSPCPSPWTFNQIPYILTRVEKQIQRPVIEREDGKYVAKDRQAKGTAWTLSISEDPDWLAVLQKFYQQQEIIRLKAHPEFMQLNAVPDNYLALPSGQAAIAPSSVNQPELIEVVDRPIDNGRILVYQEINRDLERAGKKNKAFFDEAKASFDAPAEVDSWSKLLDQLSDGEVLDFAKTVRSLADRATKQLAKPARKKAVEPATEQVVEAEVLTDLDDEI